MDKVHHIAISVQDVRRAADWYQRHFDCKVSYLDDTWAMIDFQNIQLALVIASEHPPHVGLMRIDAEKFGPLTAHRDGTQSVYIEDSEGNSVEILKEN